MPFKVLQDSRLFLFCKSLSGTATCLPPRRVAATLKATVCFTSRPISGSTPYRIALEPDRERLLAYPENHQRHFWSTRTDLGLLPVPDVLTVESEGSKAKSVCVEVYGLLLS